MNILSIGAEAVIHKTQEGTVLKQRVQKGYRIHFIDERMRKQRTRREAKLLQKLEGIAPKVFEVDEHAKTISMEYIQGRLVKDILDTITKKERETIMSSIGKQVAAMHTHNIAHGDLTTSNMILDINNTLRLIDFGLGFTSLKIEDKAVDLHLFKQALESKHYQHYETLFQTFLASYNKHYVEAKDVLKRLEKVEKRGRYKRKLGS